MEEKILKEILKRIEEGKKAALVTLTSINGSVPRKSGSMMGVFSDGDFVGTIGGGKIEFTVLSTAIEALKKDEDMTFSHSLSPNGDLKMACGGSVEGFIKIFKPKDRLLIIGAGHIGEKILHLGNFLGFETVVVDDREEYKDKESLKEADKVILGSISKNLKEVNIDENTYIVIVTRSHITDMEALRAVINSDAKYIGLIGSKRKTLMVKETLIKEGISKEKFERVYGPVGLDICNHEFPEQIAMGILSEILLIKNNGTLSHRKYI